MRLRAAGAAIGLLSVTGVLPGTGAATARHELAGWRISALRLPGHGGSSFSEPGIAVGPHGTMMGNACTANSGRPATFWRSDDRGRTWSRGFPIGGSAIGCGDADAAIGSDGYHYALILGTGVDVYRSRHGKTWHGPASFPPPHGADQPDRPWLVTVPRHPAEVLMFNSEGGGNIVEWRSTDHARTFTGPIPVSSGANSQAALTLGSRPLVTRRHPERLRLFYETAGPAGSAGPLQSGGPSQFPLTQLWEAGSRDGGRTWRSRMVLDVTTTFGVNHGTIGHLLPATAVDPAGHAYVVLSVQLGTGTRTHLYFLHSTRRGWSKPFRIDRGTPSNVLPALAVWRRGRVFVSWYASSDPNFDDAQARWSEAFATSYDGRSRHPRFRQVTLSGSTPVHVGAVENAGAVGSDLGQNWALRDFQSLAVDRCGHPHVTWASDYRSERTYAATTAIACR